MNFSSLRYFVHVAEELNISKAAQKLFMTQQSLSNRINRLEEELHVELFTRTPSFSLTYAGKSLYKIALQILDLEKQIYAQIEDINDEKAGQLSIGLTRNRARTILPQILPTFSARYPRVEIQAVITDNSALLKKLQAGEIDLAIINSPQEDKNTVQLPLIRDKFCLIVPQRFLDKQYSERILDFSVLSKEFWNTAPFLLSTKTAVRRAGDDFFRKRNYSPHIQMEISDIDTLFSLCMSGMGVIFSYEMYAQTQLAHLSMNEDEEKVHIVIIDDDTLSADLKILYRKDRYLSHIAGLFIGMAQQKFSQPKTISSS